MRLILALLMFTFFACGDSSSSASGSSSSDNTTTTDSSKSYKTEIKDRLSTYLDYMDNGDYEKSLDFTFPELFTIVPKQQMLAAIKMAFSMEGMDMSMSDTKILDVSDKLVEEDGKKYTTVNYKTKMKMALSGQMAAVAGMMQPEFDKQYGADNVDFDESSTTFTINANNKMIAIKQDGEWYFAETGVQQKPIMTQLFDKDLLDKLGVEL